MPTLVYDESIELLWQIQTFQISDEYVALPKDLVQFVVAQLSGAKSSLVLAHTNRGFLCNFPPFILCVLGSTRK